MWKIHNDYAIFQIIWMARGEARPTSLKHLARRERERKK
jgi:hypothetical protein